MGVLSRGRCCVKQESTFLAERRPFHQDQLPGQNAATDPQTPRIRRTSETAPPDSPWVDAADGADVRIAMTVVAPGEGFGRRLAITREAGTGTPEREVQFQESWGVIQPDLTIGPDVFRALPLRANAGLCAVGFQLNGRGFVVPKSDAHALGMGSELAVDRLIRPLCNGRDISRIPRGLFAIDLDGLSEVDVRRLHPAIYQWILERVKPERDQNPEPSRRDNWWLFGRRNTDLRNALASLRRFIGGPVTAKHRIFTFFAQGTILDSSTFALGSDDALVHGILSSRIHVCWAVRAGTNMGVGNDPRYNKTRCFETFPFPIASDAQITCIRELAEQLDIHRKRQQQLRSDLTLTDMYNVLDKLRSGESLTVREHVCHEQGLVSVLQQIHDDLDAAVFNAYDWPATLTDNEILERLVALNAARAIEEAEGHIRWLRPEYQNPNGVGERQAALSLAEVDEEDNANATSATNARPVGKARKAAKREWPKGREAQAKVVLAALRDCETSVTTEQLAEQFSRAHRETINELLEALTTLGQARRVRGGKYTTKL